MLVWDNVLDSIDHRKALHEYASKSGLGHKCFSRPLTNHQDRNVIERTLDAILAQMEENDGICKGNDGDSVVDKPRQYVEYWTRQEWRHIEAHADVDENLAKHQETQASSIDGNELQNKFPSTFANGYRYPHHGHVLYVQVGSEVKGPTCVFPGRRSGGDLLQASVGSDVYSSEKLNEEECTNTNDANNEGDEKQVQLIAVPAKSGRLLRFSGTDLHAVPRPHDLWMLPFVKGSPETDPEELWGRSVILFNVWPGDEAAPLDVPLDLKEDNVKIEDEGETKEDASSLCNSFSNWEQISIVQKTEVSAPLESQSSNKSVKVWLLGNERRREYPMRTVPLFAPEEGGREVVKEALAESDQVTELWLRQS